MGFRFQKRIKIINGVWLNISKSGISISIGQKGFTFNFSKDGDAKLTAGIPGSGLSYSKQFSNKDSRNTNFLKQLLFANTWFSKLLIVAAIACIAAYLWYKNH